MEGLMQYLILGLLSLFISMMVSLTPLPDVSLIEIQNNNIGQQDKGYVEESYLTRIYDIIINSNNKIDPRVAKYLSRIIEEESLDSGWNPLYIASIVDMESSFKVNNVNKSSGARGLMQVVPMHYKWEEDYGLNIHKGINILNYCYKMTKDCLLTYECFCAGNKYKEFYRSGKYICNNRKIKKFKDNCRLE
jgi:hypothetical protein